MTVPDLPVEAPQARAATIRPPVRVSQPHRAHRRCRDRVPDRGRRTPSCITCWATTPLFTPPQRWYAPGLRVLSVVFADRQNLPSVPAYHLEPRGPVDNAALFLPPCRSAALEG